MAGVAEAQSEVTIQNKLRRNVYESTINSCSGPAYKNTAYKNTEARGVGGCGPLLEDEDSQGFL